MSWLVTGGAGYIGAHVVAAMRAAGQDVVVLDDLSTGIEKRVAQVPLVVGSTLDRELVARTLREHRVRGVVHLAAKKAVEESVREPLSYYRENVEGLRCLLEAAASEGVDSFVFSSSAAVYGESDVEQVDERTQCRPINPYGRTKLIGEQMVADVAAATGLRYASLRYFNVAGCATPELADRGVSNLVPMVFQRLVQQQPPVIFGDDYSTHDGTCVRDFIHVQDIASAHAAAAAALAEGRITDLVANIGRGEGVSVREMIAVIREVTGTAGAEWSEPTVLDRRPGDPPRVVASAEVIEGALGWRASFGVREMVESAWAGWPRP
ncbi:UDP-galactose 4-epimerase [Blastococcus sp. DSM 46786]|uniref:UDP-glucose 4-epimerase GalE n=1 Tax=Blastococcus sp. DSM 46786 TaxID=1798227 RepID=UPI0008CC9556|nr:UDP-glucose 4-epimerase GalE [Blastococcus sp. DSM 46786]SEL64262.1 UDP-galactose 4-epimerase [Blastococcus sp. DSM 46786]